MKTLSEFDSIELRPSFNIQVAGKTIQAVDERLISLTLTDKRGFEADELVLVLDDTDQNLNLPPRGTQIALALGWEGEALVNKGVFTVDEINHSGPPDQLTITARSADFRDTFNVKRDHSWHDVKVGDVLAAIASRYQLQALVSEDLATITIDHSDQTNESDGNYLTRMAEMLGAITTIKNGKLLFMHPGMGVSASGEILPAITITRSSGDRHTFSIADREAYTGVEANWLDLSSGTNKTIKANKESNGDGQEYLKGQGGNVYVLRTTYATEQAAQQAAVAKLQQLQRGSSEFSITLAQGRADLFPELRAKVEGFKQQIDKADWIIAQVVHTINGDGFKTSIDLEEKSTGQIDVCT